MRAVNKPYDPKNQSYSCCFKFESDYRDASGRGEIRRSREKVFNHWHADTDGKIRGKFFKLFISQAFTGVLLRITFRIYDFLAANSIIRGLQEGKYKFQMHCFTQREQGKVIHRFAKAYFITTRILASIVCDIIKIATYPLAMVGLQIVSLIGMCLPLDGLVFISAIEEFYYVEPCFKRREGKQPLSLGLFSSLLEVWGRFSKKTCCMIPAAMLIFAAPCMQTERMTSEKHLYRLMIPCRSEYTVSHRIWKLYGELRKYQPYFTSTANDILENDVLSIRPDFSNPKDDRRELDTHGRLRINFQSTDMEKDKREYVAEHREGERERAGEDFDKIIQLQAMLHNVETLMKEFIQQKDRQFLNMPRTGDNPQNILDRLCDLQHVKRKIFA